MLVNDLDNFTGTESYFRHGLNRDFLYTEGAQYFAEQAGAYWFLDIMATEVAELQGDNPFISVEMTVFDQKAVINATDGDETYLWGKRISFTDCPDGTYKFFLIDNVFLLRSEY
jgi:hypothetical protein